jgi:hypothetical protein
MRKSMITLAFLSGSLMVAPIAAIAAGTGGGVAPAQALNGRRQQVRAQRRLEGHQEEPV